MQNGTRVRVEGDSGRHGVDLGSTLDDGPHYSLMAKVQAVEDAKR